LLKKEKDEKNFITLIVHINEWRFQSNSLLGYEIVYGRDVTTSLLHLIRAENIADDVVGWER